MKIISVAAFIFIFTTNATAQVPKDKTQIKQTELKEIKKKNENTACYTFKSGRIFHSVEGKELIVQKDISLKNGSTLKPDGTVLLKDGMKIKLKEGQCIYINGNIERKLKKGK